MASLEELQEELVRQSSRRLEVEHDRVRLEELWRSSVKQLAAAKTEYTALQEENAALAQRLNDMEDELADLSSSLVDQANQQVSDANRRAAAAHKLVEERDGVIEFQQAQLHALKEMLERNEEERSQTKRVQSARNMARVASQSSEAVLKSPMLVEPGSPAMFASPGRTDSPFEPIKVGNTGSRIAATALPGIITRELVLDLDAYASPLRPIMRTDLRDFTEFLAAWGSERDVHPTMFAKLETPPWRRVKFVQRVIQEDIETTLRLDRTPHLSWLSSRAFLNGVLDQTLLLEPVSAKERPWAQRPSQPCLLCGENRSDAVYSRTFWARPAAEAETIVLDLTCVMKTRLVCEFVAFLRSLASRPLTSDVDKQVRAWRQCNSMREQLFWARTGGLFPEAAEALEAVMSSAKDDFEFDVEERFDSEPADNLNRGESPQDAASPVPQASLGAAILKDVKATASPTASLTASPTDPSAGGYAGDPAIGYAHKDANRGVNSSSGVSTGADASISTGLDAAVDASDAESGATRLSHSFVDEGQEFQDAVDTMDTTKSLSNNYEGETEPASASPHQNGTDLPTPIVEALTISPHGG